MNPASRLRSPFARAAAILLVAFSLGCSSLYYSTMEKFGYEKRDILVKRVGQARDSQEEAKQQFASALDKFKSVVKFNGGDLEAKYNDLKTELDRSETRAKDVHDRIDSVEGVSKDLFAEWKKELSQYSDQTLRRRSEDEMNATQRRCDALIAAMRRAESRIEPVLKPLRDQVLFLKHNLNAQAINSIQGELAGVQTDTDALVADLNKSIAEADSFIKQMKSAE